jgi:hypothetical protein
VSLAGFIAPFQIEVIAAETVAARCTVWTTSAVRAERCARTTKERRSSTSWAATWERWLMKVPPASRRCGKLAKAKFQSPRELIQAIAKGSNKHRLYIMLHPLTTLLHHIFPKRYHCEGFILESLQSTL